MKKYILRLIRIRNMMEDIIEDDSTDQIAKEKALVEYKLAQTLIDHAVDGHWRWKPAMRAFIERMPEPNYD